MLGRSTVKGGDEVFPELVGGGLHGYYHEVLRGGECAKVSHELLFPYELSSISGQPWGVTSRTIFCICLVARCKFCRIITLHNVCLIWVVENVLCGLLGRGSSYIRAITDKRTSCSSRACDLERLTLVVGTKARTKSKCPVRSVTFTIALCSPNTLDVISH
jgi:hypothetical protein